MGLVKEEISKLIRDTEELIAYEEIREADLGEQWKQSRESLNRYKGELEELHHTQRILRRYNTR